jgi:hypothetical protein
MVAPEPGEPPLLYITVMADAISMVLVAERPELVLPQAPKGIATSRSGSQGPEPIEGPRKGDAVRSHELEATPAPEPQERSWPSEATMCPDDQEAVGP